MKNKLGILIFFFTLFQLLGLLYARNIKAQYDNVYQVDGYTCVGDCRVDSDCYLGAACSTFYCSGQAPTTCEKLVHYDTTTCKTWEYESYCCHVIYIPGGYGCSQYCIYKYCSEYVQASKIVTKNYNVGTCTCITYTNDICPNYGTFTDWTCNNDTCCNIRYCQGDSSIYQLGGCNGGRCGNCSAQDANCNAGKPSNLSVQGISPTKATITWTPGSNGTAQRLYVGNNVQAVENNCPSGIGLETGCVVEEVNLTNSQSSYTTGDVLSPGTAYMWRIVNYKNSSCSNDANKIGMSSCDLSPSSLSLPLGTHQQVSVQANSSSLIANSTFTPGSGLISVDPSIDTTYPYETLVTAGSNVGTTNLDTQLKDSGGNILCESTTPVVVKVLSPWWQVKDSDINTSGSVSSTVPLIDGYFNLNGSGGYPGVVTYGVSLSTGLAQVSTQKWTANTTSVGSRIYDYNYFVRNLPQDLIDGINDPTNNALIGTPITATTISSGGYEYKGIKWYKYSSSSGTDLEITDNLNLGTDKVVLLVEGANIYIKGKINLTDGSGFFGLFVGKDANGNKGNIIIDPSVGGMADGVPEIQGLYLADGTFSTGVADTQLHIKGAVAGLNGVNLQRDLVDDSVTPAEYFEYAPDQVMFLINKNLGVRKLNWKEVAP